MSNTYDIANDLERAVRESDEFTQLKEAHKAVESDPAAQQMFANFRQVQMSLQEKQMNGEQISEDEAQKAQQQFQLVQQNQEVSALMAAEQKMSVLISDLNRIITKPLEDLYGNPDNNEQ